MSTWKQRVNISHVHRLYEAGQISLESLGHSVAAKLKNLSYYCAEEPEYLDIVGEFEDLDRYSDIDDYNIALDWLYDFADEDKRLLIETILSEEKEKAEFARSVAHSSSFEDKLELYGVDLSTLTHDMYEYLKNSDPEYQTWLLERWKKFGEEDTRLGTKLNNNAGGAGIDDNTGAIVIPSL